MERDFLKKFVFLTGSTGFLGTQIARRLIKMDDIILILLIRGKTYQDARRRIFRAWWEFPELIDELNKADNNSAPRILIMNGDIIKENLDLEVKNYKYFVHNVTHIIHAAADLRLNASIDELKKINVQGTSNIIKIAVEANKNHGIERFSYISTAYVAGCKKGTVDEDSLTDQYGFKSNYERSKYEGECVVKNSDLPITIFRPGMIVGDSSSGYIKTFNTIYVLLRLYMKGKLRFVPVSSDLKINLVPVDYVADAISKLTFNMDTTGMTFHLTAPKNSLPTASELVDFVREWGMEKLGLKLPKAIFIPIGPLIPIQNLFLNQNTGPGKAVNELSPYLTEDRDFLVNNSEKFLGKYQLNWRKFLDNLMNFAVYYGFYHRSVRTVHEQILFRLNSESLPVKYFDVVDGNYLQFQSSDLRNDIIKAVNALKSLGIKSGDKVAVAGFNSSRYLILDVAIGLTGAVNVPIYYTSPVNEINEIVEDCNARLIFLGTPELIDHANEIGINTPVISFHWELPASTYILSWDDFLNRGNEQQEGSDVNEISAPVDFNDIATIRYTSGTTGKPAGVKFTHGNLRWMAEFIASMPPWKDRTSNINYLSFLPMNHVVEGILGIYSPYYAPASLNIYFLQQFQDLEKTLSHVRPSIFFSVPRFYEKVWSKIQSNWLGNMYLNTNNDQLKYLMGKILKRSVLKQVGLDACAQLIVGSAPISEELLMSFHELGIEVHNAYGLTEAPLVTINKLGSNKIGTVGKPLPKTELRLKDDGEIILRGPQVTPGYYKDNIKNNLLIKDNWLLTGDYGYINQDGSLVITGRKKELIVNSYGKSVSPLKVEGLLKLIDKISEVMLVGDNKPYCIALIWVDENIEHEFLTNAIKNVNSKLSNPEQIKRWIVLKNDLSIESRDLTANLKLKRTNILTRHEKLVNLIYDDNYIEKLVKMPDVIDFGSEGKNNEY